MTLKNLKFGEQFMLNRTGCIYEYLCPSLARYRIIVACMETKKLKTLNFQCEVTRIQPLTNKQ